MHVKFQQLFKDGKERIELDMWTDDDGIKHSN